MFYHSESRDQLAPAKVAAVAELTNAIKNAKNPHFKNDYADLPEVLDTIRPVFAKHGLSLDQWTVTRVVVPPGDAAEPIFMAGCITEVKHVSGQWERGELLLPVTKADAQGVGSAITYARRYAAAAAAGIASENDDDGNAAAARKKPAPAPKATKVPSQAEVIAALDAAADQDALVAAGKLFALLPPGDQAAVIPAATAAKARIKAA